MKLARFAIDGTTQVGWIDSDAVVSFGPGATLDAYFAVGSDGLPAIADQAVGARYALDDVDLLAPVSASARCLFATGWNYRSHLAEGNAARGKVVEEPTVPTFFSKPATTIIGPFDPIALDEDWSQQFDYEAELVVVVGRPGRDISEDAAMSHVFGYTTANDVSARDIQHRHGGQWFKGKGIDGTCPLGPWIVSADEIPDPSALVIECVVNGEVRQSANTATMAFSVPRLIAELSRGMTLLPGDMLLTGTPAGVGWARKPPSFLEDGDEVVTRISSIGEMRNRVLSLSAATASSDRGRAIPQA
jgi:2,4-didehydro-3-deoxy-L-rhamnonate hydrolase